MSIRGDFDAGLAGDFIKSLIEERDFAPQNAIAVVAASSTFAAQFPIIVEATVPEQGYYNSTIGWQYRHVITGYRFGSILGGDAGIGNGVPVVSVPARPAPAFSRYYVRVRGRFPLVPDSFTWLEGSLYLEPMGAIALLQGGGIVPTRSISIHLLSRPDSAILRDTNSQISGLALNKELAFSEHASPAIRLTDRVVAFSVNEALGGGNIFMRYVPGWLRNATLYQGGPTDYFEFPVGLFGTQELQTLKGPEIGAQRAGGDFIPESSDATNPPSLLAPHQPMIGAAIGAPAQTIYLECMFLGSVPEAAARPEEYFELAEPISLS